MTSAVRLEQVSVTFYSSPVLRRVTMEIPRGSLFLMIGPNGAGKSTLLRCILGMVPYEGRLWLFDQDGRSLSNMERARQVAYMPQIISTTSNFPVEDFVRMGTFPWREAESPEAQTERVHDALRQCRLDDLRCRPIQSLSGGERQRALLAQVIVQNTPLMILDEPTVFLDIHHQALFEDIIVSLQQEGRTILFISHDIFSAKRIATHVAALKQGELLMAGIPDEVLTLKRIASLFDLPQPTVQTWFSQSWIIGESGEAPAGQ